MLLIVSDPDLGEQIQMWTPGRDICHVWLLPTERQRISDQSTWIHLNGSSGSGSVSSNATSALQAQDEQAR